MLRGPLSFNPPMSALKDAGVDYVVPLHCSGEALYDKARSELPGKVLRAYTGTQLTFAA